MNPLAVGLAIQSTQGMQTTAKDHMNSTLLLQCEIGVMYFMVL